jgi:glycosyltransferase involved in cell wall biosynthesis
MTKRKKEQALVILTPAFAVNEENWLISQAGVVRKINELFPALRIVILVFHFPICPQKHFSWHGNEVIAFNGGMKKGIHTLRRWLQAWRALHRIRKRYEVLGLFSFFCSESAFIGHYFAKRYGLKHLIWVLGQDARKENRQVRRIRPAADELVTISDFLVREFEKNHGVRPRYTIPIGVDADKSAVPADDRDIDIIGVGALIPAKQYDVFVEVVAALAKKIPTLKAEIYGGGIEHDALRQQIAHAQLDKILHLAGEAPHAAVLRQMKHSKVLLHPSAYEGFGMVCTEALCAGAHVVSFCRPMDAEISHWHIVSTKEEMIAKCLELLQSGRLDHSGILPYNVKDTAVQVLRLFDYEPAIAGDLSC